MIEFPRSEVDPMRIRSLPVLLILAAAPFAFAADEENPYKKTKVGDFATYKMTTKVAGMNLEGTITQKVSAKNDKEVTLSVTGSVNGMEIPAQEQKIDLTKPYDPTKASLPPGAEATVEKLKDGKEKIKVGGKEYETKWESFKVKAKVNGMEIESEVKAWMSKELHLLMVKLQMTAEAGGMKIEVEMELSESGSKAD
jgi:hypothetical protein